MGDGAAPATLCKKSPRRKRKRNEVGVRTSYHAVLPSPLSIFPLSCFFFFLFPRGCFTADIPGRQERSLAQSLLCIRKSGIDDEAPFDFARTHLLSFHPPRPTIIPGAILDFSRNPYTLSTQRVLGPKLISYYISFCTPSLV